MADTLNNIIRREIRLLFQLKKTERLWHVPVLASLCVGIPLLVGYFAGHLEYGIVACLGGLVILYLPSTNFKHRRSMMLFVSRLTDIVVGSLIGGIGGWLLHHQQLKAKADRHMRIAKVFVLRKR